MFESRRAHHPDQVRCLEFISYNYTHGIIIVGANRLLGMMSMREGFSLIELLVVVAIIAILAALAIPAYLQYRDKLYVVEAINVLRGLAEQIEKDYAKGITVGSTYSYNGLTITANGTQAVTTQYGPAVYSLEVWGNGEFPSNQFLIGVRINNLKTLPASVGYAPGVQGDEVLMRGTENNGVFSVLCGRWEVSWMYNIPLNYLPPGCSCQNLSSNTC